VRTQAHQRPETVAEQPDDAYSISETKIRRLHPAHLAFIRHVGPYEAVPDTLFDSLEDWATNQGLAGPRIWMGIGHDAPGTTRPEHLRFDAAVVVPAAFSPRGPIGHQVFEGGEFAVTTHAGPFVTLPAVITRDPRTGTRNVGMYRMQKIDSKTTFMHWQIHKDGAADWRGMGDRLEVAVALGCDPVTTYSASAPLPKHIDQDTVLEAMDPEKDADGLHPMNLGRLVANVSGPMKSPLPCTPKGCVELPARPGIAPEIPVAVGMGGEDMALGDARTPERGPAGAEAALAGDGRFMGDEQRRAHVAAVEDLGDPFGFPPPAGRPRESPARP